ncbi:hypothetical protein F5146DRAFT_548099 [Armillaria mellea]|nr:hypothetical protein F5146DRAFT_548099 [Armillaria mellea]
MPCPCHSALHSSSLFPPILKTVMVSITSVTEFFVRGRVYVSLSKKKIASLTIFAVFFSLFQIPVEGLGQPHHGNFIGAKEKWRRLSQIISDIAKTCRQRLDAMLYGIQQELKFEPGTQNHHCTVVDSSLLLLAPILSGYQKLWEVHR